MSDLTPAPIRHQITVNRTREGLFSAHCRCGWEAGPAVAVHPELAAEVELHGSLNAREDPVLPDCHDCGVEVGQVHLDGCDVARCLQTGLQRLSCDRNHPADCGRDVWTGRWPGEAECEEYGFWLDDVVDGVPDLNRLFLECRWDPTRVEWVKA